MLQNRYHLRSIVVDGANTDSWLLLVRVNSKSEVRELESTAGEQKVLELHIPARPSGEYSPCTSRKLVIQVIAGEAQWARACRFAGKQFRAPVDDALVVEEGEAGQERLHHLHGHRHCAKLGGFFHLTLLSSRLLYTRKGTYIVWVCHGQSRCALVMKGSLPVGTLLPRRTGRRSSAEHRRGCPGRRIRGPGSSCGRPRTH